MGNQKVEMRKQVDECIQVISDCQGKMYKLLGEMELQRIKLVYLIQELEE